MASILMKTNKKKTDILRQHQNWPLQETFSDTGILSFIITTICVTLWISTPVCWIFTPFFIFRWLLHEGNRIISNSGLCKRLRYHTGCQKNLHEYTHTQVNHFNLVPIAPTVNASVAVNGVIRHSIFHQASIILALQEPIIKFYRKYCILCHSLPANVQKVTTHLYISSLKLHSRLKHTYLRLTKRHVQ